MSTPITNNLSSIKRYSEVVDKAKNAPINTAMDQQAFLKLFTTQLQNQNPLDPMKNENFVAQLAQFSQLEATTNMAGTLKSYVDSNSGQHMLASAALIGRKVSVEGASATLSQGQPVSASVQLEQGADGMTVQVLDSTGKVVRTASYGPQTAGTVSMTWDGRDNAGNVLADGNYTFKASAVVNGNNTNPAVSVMATVQSIRTASDGSLNLVVQGGQSVALSKVTTITE
ncbi:MAG: flagellar hook assembly protein FlgD [Limnohabitans sp.]|jgi:flagellar basal-body rod modification protein FlgD